MQKEELLLQKRFIELSKNAYHRNIVMYSDFLNLNELHILHTMPKGSLFTEFQTFGGYEYSERQIVAFLPDALCHEQKYPLTILKITPLQKKFAEKLNHRDYLGGILNLGIERSKLGDILVWEDSAVIFVQSNLAHFLMEQLTRIKHTSVMMTAEDPEEFHYQPQFEECSGSVASVRLDSLLSLAFHFSRSKAVPLIEGGRVFVNGKLITTNSFQVKTDDIISARGLGRFLYAGSQSQSKKGRYFVSVKIYK
ncbi:MAG: YlmH/Sll1252 family protein [Lachnospiraceae bacterium]